MITIREWMKNKTILISGGTGFFGKVLIEKLLRSCPEVKRIYVIVRSKHGQNPQERWAKITKDALFEKLLTQSPDVMERKVTVLDGDMSLINLGLSQETIEELKNTVNIIFHTAATVRFNDPLHKAFLSNTRGTIEMCKLASETNNLDVFVHVSTTYCNCNLKKTNYEEKVYEPCQDWKTILKLIEKENPAIMNILSYKIIQDHPNTYTFSKSLCEKVVEEYSSKFPTVIARPPVVIGILSEPIPGWTDNINGVQGIATGLCKGVLRVVKGRKNCCLDYITVDYAINALIVSSWEKAIRFQDMNRELIFLIFICCENKELSVYNCTYSDTLPFSFENMLRKGVVVNEKYYPFENDIWYPFLIFTLNDFYFRLLFFLLQLLPALVIDSILFLMKKKTRLIKLNIKIYQALLASTAFTVEDIKFDNKNYHILWEKLTREDEEIFPISPPPNFSWEDTLLMMHKGIKKYFLKESFENSEYQRLKLRRMYYLDRFVRGLLISAGLMSIYKFLIVSMY